MNTQYIRRSYQWWDEQLKLVSEANPAWKGAQIAGYLACNHNVNAATAQVNYSFFKLYGTSRKNNKRDGSVTKAKTWADYLISELRQFKLEIELAISNKESAATKMALVAQFNTLSIDEMVALLAERK